MGRSLSLTPLSASKVEPLTGPLYQLKIIQFPINARESVRTNIKPGDGSQVQQKLHKRLIQPFPILSLKIFDGESKKDITDHILSLFFVKASIIVLDGQAVLKKRDSPAILDPIFDVNNELMVGSKVVSQSYFTFRSHSKLSGLDSTLAEATVAAVAAAETRACDDSVDSIENDVDLDDVEKGMFIFKFADLGIMKKGYYKLKFDLYKFELFSNDCPGASRLSKIQTVYSNEIKVYGSKEYYKKDLNIEILKNVNVEKLRFSQDIETISTYKFLKSINFINFENESLAENASLPLKRKPLCSSSSEKPADIKKSRSGRLSPVSTPSSSGSAASENARSTKNIKTFKFLIDKSFKVAAAAPENKKKIKLLNNSNVDNATKISIKKEIISDTIKVLKNPQNLSKVIANDMNPQAAAAFLESSVHPGHNSSVIPPEAPLLGSQLSEPLDNITFYNNFNNQMLKSSSSNINLKDMVNNTDTITENYLELFYFKDILDGVDKNYPFNFNFDNPQFQQTAQQNQKPDFIDISLHTLPANPEYTKIVTPGVDVHQSASLTYFDQAPLPYYNASQNDNLNFNMGDVPLSFNYNEQENTAFLDQNNPLYYTETSLANTLGEDQFFPDRQTIIHPNQPDRQTITHQNQPVLMNPQHYYNQNISQDHQIPQEIPQGLQPNWYEPPQYLQQQHQHQHHHQQQQPYLHHYAAPDQQMLHQMYLQHNQFHQQQQQQQYQQQEQEQQNLHYQGNTMQQHSYN